MKLYLYFAATEYVVVGSGGALWYRYDEEAALELEQERGIVANIFEAIWGFVGLRLSSETLSFEFIDTEGSVIYSYERQRW